MALKHSPSIATDGLVFCVDAGNTKSYPGSGVTWIDLVGNNSLTNVGSTFISGAMKYSGVNYTRSLGVGTSALDSQTVSAEIWVSASTFNQPGCVLEKGTLNSQYSLITWTNGYFYWRVVNVSGALFDLYPARAGRIIDGAWNHIVGTFTSGDQRLYANGTLLGSNTNAPTLATGKSGITVGSDGYGSNAFSGSVAIARVYNRVLTADEVWQNFSAGRGRFGL